MKRKFTDDNISNTSNYAKTKRQQYNKMKLINNVPMHILLSTPKSLSRQSQ